MTDLCFAANETGGATLSYKQEDVDWTRDMRGKQHIHEGPRRTSAPTKGPMSNSLKRLKGPTTQTSQPTIGKTTKKKTTNMRGPTGPNMGPPRRERDSGDINPMAYQDHIGTEIQNQKGQRTTDKTTRPGLTGKRGQPAHQIQRATTAHQRQPGQCGIGGPRTQPHQTHPVPTDPKDRQVRRRGQ